MDDHKNMDFRISIKKYIIEITKKKIDKVIRLRIT